MDRLLKAARRALLAIAVATPAFAQAPDAGKADIIALAKAQCAMVITGRQANTPPLQ